jgi:diaminohydroxyphosphoribosylaminopyrimidine deaminase / 5-amino-6-(5-phosphoribosylamino)uracil reductase
MTNSAATRPQVTLKLATSLDGAIATRTGHSKWITGPESRERVHLMRASHDCVLTGIGTVLADDPELTARTQPPPKQQPLRVVLDSKARTPSTAKLLNSAHFGPVCLFHDHHKASNEPNVTRLCVDPADKPGGLNLIQVLDALTQTYQVETLMVEAGAGLAGAFLKAGLVDKLIWFRAPIIIGADGLSVFAPLGVDDLSQALRLDCLDISKCGHDVVETYRVLHKS